MIAKLSDRIYYRCSTIERTSLGNLVLGMDDPTRYRLLSLLEANPDVSQRQLAKEVGMSLGKTNYCLQALIEKGWVRIHNFKNSNNKRSYLYRLTPSGIKERAKVTHRFLSAKIREHEEIVQEIERLRKEVKSSTTTQD